MSHRIHGSTMNQFNRTIADVLCCFTSHTHDDLQQPAKLQRLSAKAHSPMSMSTPCTTLPTAYDSTDALQNIFASSASTRGYHAVNPMQRKHPVMQGSLDFNFRFGEESPKKKQTGRLEQLASHVRHQLSESHVDKSQKFGEKNIPNGRKALAGRSDLSIPLPTQDSLGRSQGSAGLTDFLASRTVSQGGYDSDAHSIQSPVTLSKAGTIRISPKYVRKSLAAIENSPVDEPSSIPEQVDRPTKGSPHPDLRTALTSIPRSTSPAKSTFTDACQVGPDESPKDVLRRLNEGIARGTIKMPETPELQATQVSRIDESDPDWHFSLSAPRRASSLSKGEKSRDDRSRGDHGVASDNMKGLADRVPEMKRASNGSSAPSSLISQLDTALMGYIEKFAIEKPYAETVPSSPVTAVQVHTQAKTESPQEAGCGATVASTATDNVAPDMTSVASSAAQSVHLFNMRISHRLASTSQMPMSSSSHDLNDVSSKSSVALPADAGEQSRLPSVGRMPTFIAFEHTRRPSDPQTRKLFEQVPISMQSHFRARRSLSDGAPHGRKVEQSNRRAIIDDSSSYYGSVGEGLSSSQNISRSSTRTNSIKNVHSLAIGGRSASGPLLRRENDNSIGRLLDGAGNPWLPKTSLDVSRESEQSCTTPRGNSNARRTVGMRKQSKYLKVDSTPTPVGRRFCNSTEANEEMSEIGVDGVFDQHDQGVDSLNSEARQEFENENLSEISKSIDDLDVTPKAWLSRGGRHGWNYEFRDGTPFRNYSVTDADPIKSKPLREGFVDDSASKMWHRAFKRIGESEDHGRLLATPKFDADGRRRSMAKSTSEASQPRKDTHRLAVSPASHRRSQSADIERHHVFDSDMKLEPDRRKSVPMLSVSNQKFAQNKRHLKNGKSRMKRSLGDLGRLVAKNAILDQNGKTQSSKNPFGIWGRFPSHTREQRNGPAGMDDNVKTFDFCREVDTPVTTPVDSWLTGNMGMSLAASLRKSWKMPALKEPKLTKGNTKSMSFALSTSERARKNREGLAGRIRRLYRTKSSQFHAYGTTKGHRSSISMSAQAEHPELECLPGEGAFAAGRPGLITPGSRLDGISESNSSLSMDTTTEATSKRSRTRINLTIPPSKKDAEEWSKLYQECVGSLSALKSDSDLQDCGNPGDRRVLSLSSALRESTVDFHAELAKRAARTKEELLEQLQPSTESESGGLKMPGSFV